MLINFEFIGSSIPITNRTELFELINRTLIDYELKKANFSGVTSKSFIAFNYNTMQSIPKDIQQKDRYNEIRSKFKYQHRDIPFFILGNNIEFAGDLVDSTEYFLPIGTNSIADIRYHVQSLVNKIYKVPSTFQYNECHAIASSDSIYEGYITPDHEQYWAMYPKYFIQSCSIQMKVY